MNFRPAGYSSDEDDDYNKFTLDDDDDLKSENETKEEMRIKLSKIRQQNENLLINKVYDAIVAGNLDLVIKELDNGFDIESKVYNQFTTLLFAASVGNFEIVNELLKRGANAKAEDEGFTIFMAACSCPKSISSSENILNIIKKLLEFEVNVLEIDRKRRTALMLACEQGFIEVVEFLQPLSSLEAEDNQGWTALFYAVEAKNLDIVAFLFNVGANYNHNDIRNNNIKYYATLNEFQEVLKLFPEDDEILPEDLIINDYNYEMIFENLENNFRPNFQQDLSLLLYGMKCEKLIPLFNKSNVDLITFLTLNDQELESLGIVMSFQRNRILHGLFQFHERTWKKTSIPSIPRNESFTTSDLFAIITTGVKHIVIMEATLNYLNQNYNCSINDNNDLITSKIFDISKKIKAMNVIVKHLHKKVQQFDKIGFQSDIIRSDFNFKQNSLKKSIAINVAGIATLFILAYYSKVKFLKI